MEATEKNIETANEIAELLQKKEHTVEEARSILSYVRAMIERTSKVKVEKFTF